MKKKNSIDFTVGSPAGKLIKFAMPLVAIYVLQNLYHTADTLVVGRFVGENALAAVGSCGHISGLVLTLMSGATLGMSVVVSQYFGAGDDERLKKSVITSFYMIVALALIFSALGAVFSRQLLQLIQVPDNILDDATLYLRIIFIGGLATGLYNMATSISRALGDSITPMIVLIVTAVLNVALNVLFVVTFKLAVAGVAYATVIATVLSAVVCVVILWKKHPMLHPTRSTAKPDKEIAIQVVKIGAPSALQSSTMSLCNLVTQGLLNSFGSTVIAAYTAAVKIDNLIAWPPGGFTQAIQVYTGQNVGAGKYDRIKEGVRVSLLVVFLYSAVAGVITLLFREPFMNMFTNVTGTEMVKIGVQYLTIVACAWSFTGFNHLYKCVLTGAGDANGAFIVTAAELAARLGLSVLLSRFMGYIGLFIATPIGWVVAATVGWVLYRLGRWKTKAVVK